MTVEERVPGEYLGDIFPTPMPLPSGDFFAPSVVAARHRRGRKIGSLSQVAENASATCASGAFAFARSASAKPRRSPARQVGMLRRRLQAAGVGPRGTDARDRGALSPEENGKLLGAQLPVQL